MAKPVPHYGKWRIRFTDYLGERKSEVHEEYKQAEDALIENFYKVIQMKRNGGRGLIVGKDFFELCDYWETHKAPQKRSGDADLSMIKNHLRDFFGKRKLTQITVEDIDRYKGAKLDGLNIKTIHNHLTLLISMLNLAKKLQWIEHVPKIKKPKCSMDDSDFRYLKDGNEVNRLLAAAEIEGAHVSTLYAMAIYTGLREGELAGLKWDDINFDTGLITVQRSFDGPTKSGKIRHVPVLNELAIILKIWKLQSGTAHVFTNRKLNPLRNSDRIFQETLHRILKRAEFTIIKEHGKNRHYIRFHDLRHTFASHWVMKGVGNEDWEVIEIDTSRFNIAKNPPVKFRRSKTSLELPRPSSVTHRSTIDDLKPFINLETENDFKLAIAWLLSSLNPGGPYIVMVLYGEQGSSKSTMVQVLRAFVDANQAPLRRPPKTTDDLMVSAKSNYVIAVDNMSHLSATLSDDFCCLATGGALSKRELYSNDSETVLFAKRPIILNGIDEFVVRGDLARIPENKRMRENDFWTKFDENKSTIMGVLMNALSEALRNQDTLILSEMPRMADAFHFATAAETAFGWESGSIMKAFTANQAVANSVVLNNSLIYPHLVVLADEEWEGTATALMFRLNGMRGAFDFEPTWPRNPQSLSNRLRRLNPALRSVGILVDFDQTFGNDSDKIIRVQRIRPKTCDASDAVNLNPMRVECDSEIPEDSWADDPFFGPESQTSLWCDFWDAKIFLTQLNGLPLNCGTI